MCRKDNKSIERSLVQTVQIIIALVVAAIFAYFYYYNRPGNPHVPFIVVFGTVAGIGSYLFGPKSRLFWFVNGFFFGVLLTYLFTLYIKI
jgi:hypothetical protein